MSDVRPTDTKKDAPPVVNPNPSLSLTDISRSLGTKRDTSTLLAPGGTGSGLSSLDILRPGSSATGVKDTPRLTVPPDVSKPAATTTDTTRPADVPRAPVVVADATAGRTTDATRVSDAPVTKPVEGVLTLEYGQPGFDKSLAQKDYHTLKIRNFPENVKLKSWVDTGGYLFWYEGGKDGNAHHYFPSNLKEVHIEQWNGKQYKPYVKPADELRISAVQAAMAEQQKDKVGYSSYDNKTHPYRYAERMSAIADKQLDIQEKALREGAEASPTNPYFRIYLADVMIARAIKPVIEDVKAGKDAKLDNPETMKRIDAALGELAQARLITRQYGDIRNPNTYMQPPLMPFGLNPYYRNPDAYWSGAAYQAYQREVGLTVVKAWIKSGAIKLELPPALPPR